MVSIAATVAAAVIAGSAEAAAARHVIRDLRITVVAGPAISQALVDATLADAEAIWRPAGVALTWRRAARATSNDAAPPHQLTLMVDDGGTSAQDGRTALGWIHFTGRTPEPEIHLSRANAEDLMARTASLHDKPSVVQQILMARALGRALAHELGHYLFKSPTHRPAGLMKAVRPSLEFFSPGRNGFDITADERAWLAAHTPCPAD